MFISIGDIIKKTYLLYTKNFGIILKYLVLSILPGLLGTSCTIALMGITNPTGVYNKSIIYLGIPLLLVFFIVLIILSLWFNFAFIKVVSKLYTNQPTENIKINLDATKHVIVPGLCTSILSALYSSWPMILFIMILFGRVYYTDYLPNIATLILNIFLPLLAVYATIHLTYFVIKLIFSVFITVLENKKTKEALKDSQSRTCGRWWTITLRVIVPVFIIYACLAIIDQILMAIGSLTGDVGKTTMTVLDMVINYLAIPTSLIIGVILYHEAKKTSSEATESPATH